MTYEVIVGNIGSVYSGSSRSIADGKMRTYIEQSKTGRGRAGGENVTLLTNGEITREYIGSLADWEDRDGDARHLPHDIRTSR